jgi:hypothetical protein
MANEVHRFEIDPKGTSGHRTYPRGLFGRVQRARTHMVNEYAFRVDANGLIMYPLRIA